MTKNRNHLLRKVIFIFFEKQLFNHISLIFNLFTENFLPNVKKTAPFVIAGPYLPVIAGCDRQSLPHRPKTAKPNCLYISHLQKSIVAKCND